MRALAIAAALAAMTTMSSADAQTRLQLSTGVDFSSGKFGGPTRTDVLAAPLTARITTGAWTFRGSLPFLSVRGDQAVIGNQIFVVIDDSSGRGSNSGSGGSGSDDAETITSTLVTTTAMRRVTQSGVGDLSLSATYALNDVAGTPLYLDLSGRVRLPTGDEAKGLGLGVTDYGLTAELGRDADIGGAYISAGRRFLSDAQGINREDGWQAGIGGWLNASPRFLVGAFADWRESASGHGDDPAEIGAYVTFKATPAWKLGLNASAGLNDASPDFGVGVSLAWRTSERRGRT